MKSKEFGQQLLNIRNTHPEGKEFAYLFEKDHQGSPFGRVIFCAPSRLGWVTTINGNPMIKETTVSQIDLVAWSLSELSQNEPRIASFGAENEVPYFFDGSFWNPSFGYTGRSLKAHEIKPRVFLEHEIFENIAGLSSMLKLVATCSKLVRRS